MNWGRQADAFDEMFDATGGVRPHYRTALSILEGFSPEEIERRERLQKLSLLNQGITFTVYGEKAGIERIFPFDFVPRIVPAEEWAADRGGARPADHRARPVPARHLRRAEVPQGRHPARRADLLAPEYKRELLGVIPPRKIFTHIVRHRPHPRRRGATTWCWRTTAAVRAACPTCSRTAACSSACSRSCSRRTPCSRSRTTRTCCCRRSPMCASRMSQKPAVVILTPGLYNSAYFEHSFLARQLGVFLVEGHDLIVEDNHVFMRTTQGKQQVDVIYRRVDDDYPRPAVLPPRQHPRRARAHQRLPRGARRPGQRSGRGRRRRQVGVRVRARAVRYYLGEDALLPQVPTYVGCRKRDRPSTSSITSRAWS